MLTRLHGLVQSNSHTLKYIFECDFISPSHVLQVRMTHDFLSVSLNRARGHHLTNLDYLTIIEVISRSNEGQVLSKNFLPFLF